MMTLFAMLTLAVAVGPIAWLLRTRLAGARQWLTASAAAVAMSGSALVVGPWALLSVYLRPVIIVVLIAALVMAAYRALHTATGTNPRRRLVWQWSAVCVFGLLLIDGFAGWPPPGEATDLLFPLEGGPYAVLQGGNSLTGDFSPSTRHSPEVCPPRWPDSLDPTSQIDGNGGGVESAS